MKKLFSIAAVFVTSIFISCKKDNAVVQQPHQNPPVYSKQDTPYLPVISNIIDTPYLTNPAAVADTPYIK